MENKYKIILSGKGLYKEVELPADTEEVTVGTETFCDIRIHKDLFFEKIVLTLFCEKDSWSIRCEDNLYLSGGGVQRLLAKSLKHGDILSVRYGCSGSEALSLEFLLDFDSKNRKYERALNISELSLIEIGTAPGCQIQLSSQFVRDDSVEVQNCQKQLILHIIRSTYGVYHNGKKAEEGEIIEDGGFFSLSDYSFYFKNGFLWTEIRDDMAVNRLGVQDYRVPKDYPKFSRNTRIKTVANEEKIEILDPPAKPQKPKNNLLMKMLPAAGMILAAGVMAFFGGMMIIMSLISGVMAVVTAVLTIRENNRDYKKAIAERAEKYNAYLMNKQNEIQQCRDQEARELEEVYIGQDKAEQRILSFSPGLFDRLPEDEDYLCVRLGSGNVESRRQVNYKRQEKLEIEDELQLIPAQVFQEFRFLKNAPVVCSLRESNAIGIIGAPEYRFELLKTMVVDIAARQFYSDVKMVFVAESGHQDKIWPFRFLPYVYNEALGVRSLVCDDESKNLIFEYLYKEFSAREQNKDSKPHIIVFFYDEYGFKSHPISKFVEMGKELGITFVFFKDTMDEIPQGCNTVVFARDRQTAVLIDTNDKRKAVEFLYPSVSDLIMQEIITRLAPVYTEEISLEGTLTKNITLFELLRILSPEDLDLKNRWESSQVFRSMAAPIGVSKTGVVNLDLHDKADGPHGLVAGTTGSGKSELLQTYVLSMATLFHPHEVAFVIIDFKGGGMVNQFRNLPHLLGAITNIDGKAIERSLKSIKAELQKRQRLFAEAEVNHIDRYIKKYKAGEVQTPLPHLIIIVDEFAELKAEQPEFMKELISAARIGRSLGVHLILATQKPSGQVNEQIWSNSRFKLCLKVQSQEDSNEVLKSPLAAEIKEPGRAYLQIGNNEVFELFQSAYSGAPKRIDDSKVREFAVYCLTPSGKRDPVYVQKRKKGSGESVTQLEAVVEYIADYCMEEAIEKLPDICLPALSDTIEFAVLPEEEKALGEYPVEIGVYDDPDEQYQGGYSVDLGSNNLMIIGSSQSGKTNILQSILRSLSAKYTPEEVVVYIIDFASRVLKNFESLKHVGGVVCPSEDEKLKNLFKLLRGEIEGRKEKLARLGVSSFAAYREAGEKDLPLIVLMVDNLTALKEMYFQEDDELLDLCREGLTVGVSIVVANTQTAGIGYKYLSNFSARLALFCNDSNEYSALFDHCSERIENIPGRCIVELEKKYLECQAYLAFHGEKEIDRVKEIKSYIDQVNRAGKHSAAPKIPLIPDTLTAESVQEQFGGLMREPFQIVVGLDYSTVCPYVLDFSRIGLLAVSGRNGAGRHNWIKYCVHMLETAYPGKSKVYVADGIERKLSCFQDSGRVARYSRFPEDAVASMKEMESQLKARYEALAAGDEESLAGSELLLLVIDNPDAVTAICNDKEALVAYKNITGKYKGMNGGILLAVENANILYSAPEMLKEIRENRQVMFFDDIANFKMFDLPLATLRFFRKPVGLGDGYFIKGDKCVKLKTAKI